MQKTTVGFVSFLQADETKCKRDIGYILSCIEKRSYPWLATEER